MNYNGYFLRLAIRIVFIVGSILALVYAIYIYNPTYITLSILFLVYLTYNSYTFIRRRFIVMDDFFEAVKYRDFSRWFPEDRGPKDIRKLYTGFNEVNRTIKDINTQNEAQFVYLQKILEMVDIGIIAFNIETGKVLWSNDSFRETLDFPSFKNVNFVEKRKPELYATVFDSFYREPNSISITVQNEKIKVLISDTIFQVNDEAFKLIVLQNIDATLNKNESEAWKKLLSVMTHEIMNSIAPISSLADTLQSHLQLALNEPEHHTTDLNDLYAGVKTIKNRSEGLLKFAKTYRSLNKITQLHLEKKRVSDLFESIKLLMQPSLEAKNIILSFTLKTPKLELKIDNHLIEQVLINLILNAVDACKHKPKPEIKVFAELSKNHNILIKVYDNGAGISPEIIDNIFVPFFTSKTTGSGIGLSLCKQIMLLHKGKITVNSKEGKGTVFSLVFNS